LSRLTPLPLTDYETREIANLFSEKRSVFDYLFPETADILLHKDASKENFLKHDLEQYGFLHFATHAFINESHPNLSGIALWGEEENGILYVNDIYNMRFDADLAVLGACETGLGTLYRGEGVIGFTRAFIYAGVSNLAVSMWRVNDQPTSRLMISFYKNIRDGAGYAEALRAAKLELLNFPEFSEPKNWASFVLHGF
jgi:CHAT domain-containing protein